MRIPALGLVLLVLVTPLILVVKIRQAKWYNTFGDIRIGVSYRYINSERKVLLLHSIDDAYQLVSAFNYDKSPIFREYNLPVVYCDSQKNQTVSMVIVTTSHKMSKKLSNTLHSLHFFYVWFGVLPLVFTNDESVKFACKKLSIRTEPIPEVNPFGLPFFKSLMIAARKLLAARLYMYINSDILVNPSVILAADRIHYSVKTPSVFVGRVINTKVIPTTVDFCSVASFNELSELRYKVRKTMEIDYFIFSNDYPFEDIPPVVVGRWGVDTVIMITTHSHKYAVVDMTYIYSYHQGRDTSSNRRKAYVKDDWFWNKQFYVEKQVLTEGSIHSNYWLF